MTQSLGLAAVVAGVLGSAMFVAKPAFGGSSPPKVILADFKSLPPAARPNEPRTVVDAPRLIQTVPSVCCPLPGRSFVWGNDRYDPMIRDIRLVPNSRMLPGGDFGRRETLPVLPARELGFFVTPRH